MVSGSLVRIVRTWPGALALTLGLTFATAADAATPGDIAARGPWRLVYELGGEHANHGESAMEGGTSPQNKRVKVAGADYFLVSACKNRDCENNSTVLQYSQAQDVVYGKVYQRGKSTLIGAPPPAVATELERLWKSEWRSQPK